MCQLPFISMCVSNTKSPEKVMNIHFPRDLTLSTVLPVTGASKSTRESLGRTVSKPVTSWPASALLSDREARNIVSPSGIKQSPRTLRPCHPNQYFLRSQSDWHFRLVLRLEQSVAFGSLRLNLQIPRRQENLRGSVLVLSGR